MQLCRIVLVVKMYGFSRVELQHIHEEFLRPNLGRFLENVPNWDVFEKKSILTEVRVSVDSHGPGDHGLGAGLVV